MTNALRTLLLAVLVAGTSCSEANKHTYAQAAVGTVAAIAAVGVYRAATHDCWARCTPGYLCNEETGLCELGECLPGCEVGSHCVRDARGYHCANDLDNQPMTSSISSRSAVSPGAVSAADAGTPDASAAADAAADAQPSL